MRVLAFVGILAAAAPQQQTERFDPRLHGLIKPRADEWKWARIPWMGDLAEARKKAAAEGKPLYVWTMAGEPLGQC